MQVFYTATEIAEIIKLHPETILRYIREGKISARKFGKGYRITENAFNDFIKNT